MTIGELQRIFAGMEGFLENLFREGEPIWLASKYLDPSYLEALEHDLDTLPWSEEKLKAIVDGYLFERGWFIYYHLHLAAAMDIARCIRDGREAEIEPLALQMAKDLSANARDRLVEGFPKRTPALGFDKM